MGILDQLGVNQTYFFQLIIFVFVLIVLSEFVFKDFVQLLKKREEQTKGSEDLASEEQKKSADLHKVYENKARELNGEIKTIFEQYRQEASAEYESIVQKARQESSKLIEETRRRVSVEVGDAANQLKQEAPLVAQVMANKLLGKSGGQSKGAQL